MALVNALVKVVTGFIDIPGHPRTGADYRALGDQLLTGIEPREALVFDSDQQKVEHTWMAEFLRGQSNVTHSVADNPEKNTMAYHCVQHQKFAWIALAAQADAIGEAASASKVADYYVWIDYGILHVPGVTVAVINKYLDNVEDYGNGVRLPGCWPKGDIDPSQPCWRFCGGLMAVPRALVKPFTRGAIATAMRHVNLTGNVEWEVNTLARFEKSELVPMQWYQADHNETMFTGAPCKSA